MKSFLLRIKGTIFASAQIQKMTAKMSEKNHVVYVNGHFDKIRAEEPPLRFSWMKETCSFSCKSTMKALFLSYIYRILGYYRCEPYTCIACSSRQNACFLMTLHQEYIVYVNAGSSIHQKIIMPQFGQQQAWKSLPKGGLNWRSASKISMFLCNFVFFVFLICQPKPL